MNLLGESGGMPPSNFFKNACFEIESGAKIAMLRTGSGSLL